MKLLYFDGASKCSRADDGTIYTGHNLPRNIVERYRRYCDSLELLLIEDNKRYTANEAESSLCKIDTDLVEVATLPEIRKPRRNFFSPALRKRIADILAGEIRKADRVIVRAPGRYYTNLALKLCRKFRKTYLIESVDFVFEYLSQGRLMKFFAPYAELTCKREIYRAPYVVYVSQRALQERYPTSGKSLGCSDVELSGAITPSAKILTDVGGGHNNFRDCSSYLQAEGSGVCCTCHR